MNISKFSVKRPITILMMVLAAITLGFVSLSKLPIDLLPNIEVPVAIVSTSYPNVGSEEIEKLVTKPLEQSVATVDNIKNISSISKEGNSVIIVQFNYGTDMDFATLKMREKVDLVKGYLPEEVKAPTVLKIDPNAQPIMQLSLTKGKDLSEIQTVAEDTIKPRLERIEGVASVDVSGGYENEVKINVNQEKLQGYGLSIDYISQVLSGENLNLPSGTVKKGKQELLLRTMGEFKSIEEIENIPIPLKTGGVVYLKDIAQVILSPKDITSISKNNNKRCMNITIQKQSDGNTVEVAKRIKEEISNLKKENPKIDINPIFDSSEYIEKSISNVTKSALIGAVLAILVLYIFLRNGRSTFIIGTAIPISIITTFILIYYNHITLNLMTLGGLALGVGMLVDSSIVVLENIYRYRQEGHSRIDAAIHGASEVTTSVIASTLTTIAVFLPISFAGGLTSSLFKELALTVTFSLVASLAVSLTFIPMLSSKLLKIDNMQGKQHKNKFKFLSSLYDKLDKVFTFVETKYKKLLNKALKYRKRTVFIAIAVFIVSMISLVTVGGEFFPTTDEGQFVISVELPEGSKVNDTEEITEKINNKIKNIKEIKTIFSSSGSQGGFSLGSGGENQGSIFVILKPIKERKRSTEQVVDEVRKLTKDIPGKKLQFNTQMFSFGGGGAPISISIKGNDLETIKELGNQFKDVVESVKGTREVKSSLTEGVPEVRVKLKRKTASQYGITAAQVSSQVRSTLSGKVATKYRVDGDEIDVLIKGDETYKQSISNLKQVLIQTPTGINIPLELVADIEIERGTTAINRENQTRVVTVSSKLYGRDLKSVTEDIEAKLKNIKLPKGYTYEMGGENKDMVEAFTDLALALVLAVILIYMILASQFESLLNPFVIMLSVPLALAGGALGLFVTRRALCVPAFIGIIVLTGIVVNNAIVLIDYINIRRRRGESRKDAILEAGPIRLRPIMMTTLTTVLGLLPMALGIGEGSEVQAPMATVVIGGLLLSTLLTLVFIPVVYTIFDDISFKVKRRINDRH